jgi:gas vesicle protein
MYYRRHILGSKILFRNTTTYTENIAFEAGEAFWETQPAYKKRVKKYKVVAAIMGVTFAIAAVASLVKSGPMLLTLGAVAMALAAGFWFVKAEGMIRNSAKNFRGMDTKVTYGVSENYFFVINRDYVGGEEPQTKADEIKEKIQDALEEAKEELEEAVEDVKEEIAELVEDEDHDEDDYEDEFLSLEELLVCIVTENLYILIWPKPYYILDRRCFEEGKDAEFRAFIEEHARIIEA